MKLLKKYHLILVSFVISISTVFIFSDVTTYATQTNGSVKFIESDGSHGIDKVPNIPSQSLPQTGEVSFSYVLLFLGILLLLLVFIILIKKYKKIY